MGPFLRTSSKGSLRAIGMRKLLQNTCMRQNFSLRNQLLLSFGSAALVALSSVCLVSLVILNQASDIVKDHAVEIMRAQINENIADSTVTLANAFTQYVHNYESLVQIVTEIVQDRIVGYPEPGWENDTFVPFMDMESGENVYPLIAEPLPLDWQVVPNLTPENAEQALPFRSHWLPLAQDIVSFSTGHYYMQGGCDPSQKTPDWLTYYPNCTDANNNIELGGINPTDTNKYLYEKSAEIATLLRPLYEATSGVFVLGVYFVNEGAGSGVFYPGNIHDAFAHYVSAGCEWMRNENPFTRKPFGTEEEIERCHPKGSLVPGREYNPNEREFFQEFIKMHGEVGWFGPYNPARSNKFMVSVGKAIFDRKTGELIGCVVVHLTLKDMTENILSYQLFNKSHVGILKYVDDDDLLADSAATVESEGIGTQWSDLRILSRDCFRAMKNNIDKELDRMDWTRDSLFAAANTTLQRCPYGMAAAFPVPTPPHSFDPEYKPRFMAVHVVADDAYTPIDTFEQVIDDSLRDNLFETIALAGLAMVVTLVVIWGVSHILTRPLLWMEAVSWKIVNHKEGKASHGFRLAEVDRVAATVRCSPNTEITELVSQFRDMINGFSGHGASSHAEIEFREIKNCVTWRSEYRDLRCEGEKKRRVSILSDRSGGTNSTEIGGSSGSESPEIPPSQLQAASIARTTNSLKYIHPAPTLQNMGRNVAEEFGEDRFEVDEGTQVLRSLLFRWIYCLIVIPLIFANVLICVNAMRDITEDVTGWLDYLEGSSLRLGLAAIELETRAKSRELSLILHMPIRDLYWMTRVTGWLHSGALERADSFTEILAPTEKCKGYVPGTCPNHDRPQCVCSWGDIHTTDTCFQCNATEARRLQSRFFVSSEIDAHPETGERKTMTSFFNKAAATSPNTTKWWDNPFEVPGSHKGSTASGYATTYDRIRVSSALAVVEFPMYNYATALGWDKQQIGTYVAYDSDGTFVGFSGCTPAPEHMSFFVSNDQNHAYTVAGDICPKGMYGYDPRCRPWYKNAKAFQHQGKPIHITAPYEYALADRILIGLSAASPIFDTKTSTLIGVSLIDFLPRDMLDAFDSLKTHISFMVLPEVHQFFGDTVIGPNKTEILKPTSIVEELFQHDELHSEHAKTFEEDILPLMRKGDKGEMSFLRTTKEGTEEGIIGHFSPVQLTMLSPVDSSNLSTGVFTTVETVYSIGVACVEDEMRHPFAEAETHLKKHLLHLAVADIVLIILISLLFLLVASQISILVTKPMIVLRRVVESINAKGQSRNIPPLRGGSREVHQVYNSFSKLYKVIRLSNSAFFSGNLTWAFTMTEDALQLFREIEDKKAIGVAHNNMGNTLFAMIVQRGKELARKHGYAQRAMKCYTEAVSSSRTAFESAEAMDEKVLFATELADRLFNRGLFLLYIDGEVDAPQNARQWGLEDIAKVRDLDYDVMDYWLENKLLLANSDQCFSRMLRRVHALCDNMDDDEVVCVWDADLLLDEAEKLLCAAQHEADAPLFSEMSCTGRLQQLEAAGIRLQYSRGNIYQAARLAMRMLSEDEYVLESSFAVAANSLVQYSRHAEPSWHPTTLASLHADLQTMNQACKTPSLNFGKCVIFAFEMNERWEYEGMLQHVSNHCLNIFDEHCEDYDHVGTVAYTVTGDHTYSLCRKGENLGELRAVLERASTTGSESVSPSLPYAMQMLMDSCLIDEMEAYLIVLTDGYSWESGSYSMIKTQLERMNKERNYNVNLLVLGFEMEEADIVEDCKAMCSISKGSYFVECNENNLDERFGDIASRFSKGRLYQKFVNSVTVQKF